MTSVMPEMEELPGIIPHVEENRAYGPGNWLARVTAKVPVLGQADRGRGSIGGNEKPTTAGLALNPVSSQSYDQAQTER